jgi:hypothetical protein
MTTPVRTKPIIPPGQIPEPVKKLDLLIAQSLKSFTTNPDRVDFFIDRRRDNQYSTDLATEVSGYLSEALRNPVKDDAYIGALRTMGAAFEQTSRAKPKAPSRYAPISWPRTLKDLASRMTGASDLIEAGNMSVAKITLAAVAVFVALEFDQLWD